MSDPIREIARRLREAGIANADQEARWLHAAAFPRRYVDYSDLENGAYQDRLEDMVSRRLAREPLAHITGRRAFWNHVFDVTPDVLDPRSDTETLVELALEKQWSRVLDMGTGSGCILLSLLAEREDTTGLGIDVSADALKVAESNAQRLELTHRAEFRHSDWFEAVDREFDIIVSNPPYIAEGELATLEPEVRDHEPRIALTPGQDGLAAYRKIIPAAHEFLKPGGWLMVEIGYEQAAEVEALFQAENFHRIEVRKDLGANPRVVCGQIAARR